jgi:glycolate oxidase FAD binding subunit
VHDALPTLRDRILAAAARREVVRIRAGGTKDFYGNSPHGSVLDPRSCSGIVLYEPTELVIVAQGGTTLEEVESTLEQHHQMLAFEPPRFGGHATVGGCIASALAGPRRCAVGSSGGGVRDFILGLKLLDGQGRLLKFGGRVIKNVAGYDLARMMVGSLGIFGVIVEACFKVVPKPMREMTLRFEVDEPTALSTLSGWSERPLPISGSVWYRGALHVRLSGSRAALGAAQIGGEELEPLEASRFWMSVREQTHPFFASDEPLWRLSLPQASPSVGIATDQMIEWHGALRWIRSNQPADAIRASAHRLGGHATLFRGGDRTQGAFSPLTPALLAIHKRLRAEFDPRGIFDAGRMYSVL